LRYDYGQSLQTVIHTKMRRCAQLKHRYSYSKFGVLYFIISGTNPTHRIATESRTGNKTQETILQL
jgi:hypothetical protein